MTKSIPLRPTLSIQRIGIIIRNPRKQFLDLMLELFTSERWSLRCIQRETISISIFSLSLSLSLSPVYLQYSLDPTHSSRIISPVLISAAAALTLVGVNRFNRPISSSLPHTQAASSGAPGILGNSFLEGNTVESGFQGSWVGSCFAIMQCNFGGIAFVVVNRPTNRCLVLSGIWCQARQPFK